MSTFR
ncbi:hypothetical protein CP8484711_1331A, partial [Chlamydia psittaci 84-8471/1]